MTYNEKRQFIFWNTKDGYTVMFKPTLRIDSKVLRDVFLQPLPKDLYMIRGPIDIINKIVIKIQVISESLDYILIKLYLVIVIVSLVKSV